MLPEYTPGANLYDYAFYGPMQTDDNAILSSFQVGGMPWAQQQQQQQQGGDDQIMQYIQMYSEITESDPEEVMNQLSSMSQEDQQAALQEIVGTIQKYYTMQQSRQQNQMVDEQQQGMYDDEDESGQPVQYQKPYNAPTPEELAGLEAEEEEYNAAVEAATADYDDEEYMYGGSKRRRNKFTSQLKKAARGMAQEMVNTDGLPTGNSSYGGERLKKFVAGIQRNVANNMADEAVEQSMDYFSQPSMMRYGGLPTFQGTQNSQTGTTPNTSNITLTPEQFNQLLAYQNRGAAPQYPGMGRSVNMSNLLSMFGAAPISNDWFQPRGYSLTRKSARDFADAQKVYGTIPLDRSYLSNVDIKRGFLGSIYNPRSVSMQFSRALPPLNFPQQPTATTPAASQTQSSSRDLNVITSTTGTSIQGNVPPVTIGSSSYGLNSPSPASQPTASNQSTQTLPQRDLARGNTEKTGYVTDLVQKAYDNPNVFSSNNPEWQNNVKITSKFFDEGDTPGSILLPGQIGPLNEGQLQMENLVGKSRYPQVNEELEELNRQELINARKKTSGRAGFKSQPQNLDPYNTRSLFSIMQTDPLAISQAERANFNTTIANAPQGTSYQVISNTGLPYATPNSAIPSEQTGGQLYLYRNGGLPRFQGPDASEVTLAPRSMSNPGQSAKTFGDSEFAMEPFDNSALVAARPQPMQLPTKTLQERATEVDPDASMKTSNLKFRKDPLSAEQYTDIAYAGTNIITNLKNRADQELAQAEMLNRETDPYNYYTKTYVNPYEGSEANTGDKSRKYQSFMGQNKQFSPGVLSGFAKFGGMLKMGGTYEMDLTPEEVAYIQRMGGTIEYL